MSIFGDIVSALFKHSASSASAAPTGGATAQPKPASSPAASPAPPGSAPGGSVDVAAVMDKLAGQSKEKLDWRHSIVDMMKLLNLDSTLGARKQLAEELHYSGNMNDSATMNVWLHKQVMIELAKNGGKVPDELKR